MTIPTLLYLCLHLKIEASESCKVTQTFPFTNHLTLKGTLNLFSGSILPVSSLCQGDFNSEVGIDNEFLQERKKLIGILAPKRPDGICD